MSLDLCPPAREHMDTVQPGAALTGKEEGPSLAAGFSLPTGRHSHETMQRIGRSRQDVQNTDRSQTTAEQIRGRESG